VKIICIGRNYADHAKELNNQVPAEPVVFLKPDSAILPKGNAFFIPDFSQNLQHELEIVIRIDRLGKHIEEKFAHRYYQEFTLGLDFTARDLQSQLKEKGLPWEKAKAFDGSAFIGPWLKKEEYKLNNLNFSLLKNGETVQKGNSEDMLFSIDRIIAEVSKYFTLKIGDLIFTGTPAGVGAVQTNDLLDLHLEGKSIAQLRVK
jgi:2-keto-4-pentenoate hydratase/2-oxohepta-3-ene-1,7-dioic acid hydratase in catechol pathway